MRLHILLINSEPSRLAPCTIKCLRYAFYIFICKSSSRHMIRRAYVWALIWFTSHAWRVTRCDLCVSTLRAMRAWPPVEVRRCRHIFFLNAYVIAGQHALVHRLLSRVSEYLPASVKSLELGMEGGRTCSAITHCAHACAYSWRSFLESHARLTQRWQCCEL